MDSRETCFYRFLRCVHGVDECFSTLLGAWAERDTCCSGKILVEQTSTNSFRVQKHHLEQTFFLYFVEFVF